jgi:hypothetical protein
MRRSLRASTALVKIRQFSGVGLESAGETERERVEMLGMLLKQRAIEVCVARVKRVRRRGTRFASMPAYPATEYTRLVCIPQGDTQT